MTGNSVIVVDDMEHALDRTMHMFERAGIPAKGVLFLSEMPLSQYDADYLASVRAKGYVLVGGTIKNLKQEIEALLPQASGIVSDFDFANTGITGQQVLREILEEEGQPFRPPYCLMSGYGGRISKVGNVGEAPRYKPGPPEVPAHASNTIPDGVTVAKKFDPHFVDWVAQEFGLDQQKGRGAGV